MAKRTRKKAQSRQGKRHATRPSIPTRTEWVGGRLLCPFFINDIQPYRPELLLWIEMPVGAIVSHTLINRADKPVSLCETLHDAMRSPLVGSPRRPSRVRVADAVIAGELRVAFPDIEVVLAPTPELDDVLQSFSKFQASDAGGGCDGLSYLEGDRIPAEAIDKLFHAAQMLYHIAPWKYANDSQVLRLDIPQLGVEGACVSIIGQLGESLGFIIFPSLIAYEGCLQRMENMQHAGGPLDTGTTMLSLDYERGADLSDSLRKEIATHGWPVAANDAYPIVNHSDRDGTRRPLDERDIAVVTACAKSLAIFCAKHRGLFDHETVVEPVSESYVGKDDLEVRFTAPYEMGPDFGLAQPDATNLSGTTHLPSSSPVKRDNSVRSAEGNVRVGRNDPCPCGSGKKYKKCCLPKEKAAHAAETAPASIHDVDRRLVEDMMLFAERKFGDAWRQSTADFDDYEAAVVLWGPWSVYGFHIDGQPIVNWYIEAKQRQLSHTELTWLQAQQASWLSVWEVIDVVFGRSVTVKDMLTGQERTVKDLLASKSLACRDAVLARVVDHDDISVFCGTYPSFLPPIAAAEVVQRIRGRLRRKRAVPVDRLRDEKIGRYMIARWEEAVSDLNVRRSMPPRLQNTDGEDFLITIDHFGFDSALQQQIEQRLAQLDGVETPNPGDSDQSYAFIKRGNAHGGLETTLIGRVTITKGKLRLETNSVQRADALRKRIEAACDDRLRHRAREHSDPLAAMQGMQPGGMDGSGAARVGAGRPNGKDEDIPAEEAARIVREMKAKHYATWVDEPMPVLGGKTAREAVRTKAGSEQVDLLLKDCENREARQPIDHRFDFSAIRAELGL